MPAADSPCDPLIPCENLEGGVLVRRTVYGPALIDDPRPLAFGDFAISGGAIRPYLDLIYETRWIPKGLCRGPVSSVMSLAPTEAITAGVRTSHRDSFTQMMTDATESSSVQTRTRHQLSESTTQSPAGGGGGGGVIGGIAGAVGASLGEVFGVARDVSGAVLDIGPIFAGLFGSIFEDIGSVAGDIVGAVVGGPAAIVGAVAGNAIGGLIDGALVGAGGGAHGPILVDTQHRIDEITESMEKRESQSHIRQVIVSSSFEREEFVTRTFSNPYRDRSLQLRFLPIYRHFEVVTTIRFGIHGLAMLAGKLDTSLQRSQFGIASRFNLAATVGVAGASPASAAARIHSTSTITRAALASAQVNHDDHDVRRPMVELLIRNSDSADRKKGVRVEQGLRWSAAQVRDNVLHVPAAEPAILAKAWRLDERAAGRLSDAVSHLSPGKLPSLAPAIKTRQIHLFAGTHVEAVPGECRLPDIVTDALDDSKH